jgi:glycosyltransferase involved in cell wall biosynthesis
MPAPAHRRIRVLTLIDTLKSAGAERLSVQIASRLDPARFEPWFCASRWERRERSPGTDALIAELHAAGVKLVPLHRRGRVDVWRWAPLVRTLRRERIDVLHAHMFTSNVWGTVLGRLSRTPVVVAHEHTWSFEGAPLRRFLDRELIARFGDAFVACSGEDMRRMIEIEHIAPERLRLIPNGIAVPDAGSPHDVRAELGVARDAPVVGAVGRLTAQKAFDVLLRAAARLRVEFPGLQVLIAGDGEQRAALQSLAEELDLRDTVRFLGVRSDVPDVLAALDVAALSSRAEGIPLAALEYMEAARPVVATRVGGLSEMIEDGVQGLLVQPGDPDALAGAIAQLLRDPARREAMGAAGRERRRREYDLDTMVRRVESLYEELVGAVRISRSAG